MELKLIELLSLFHLQKVRMNIEIGSGNYPRKGYYHFDVRSNVPDLDCQADIRYLPIKDNTIDEIIAIQTLEHISWQEVTMVLVEIWRVLRPGGMVKIYVPDLKLIARQILEKEIEFAVLITWIYGGGQGIPEDFHKSGYTKDYLSMLLCQAGFNIEMIVDGEGVYVEATKKYDN